MRLPRFNKCMYVGVLIGMVGMIMSDNTKSTASSSTCIAVCANDLPKTTHGFVGMHQRRSFNDDDWYANRTLSCKASAFGIPFAKKVCQERNLPWARKEDYTVPYIHGSVSSVVRVGQRQPKFITTWADGDSYERDKNFVHDSVFAAINLFGAAYGMLSLALPINSM